jgi:hypothetical protein
MMEAINIIETSFHFNESTWRYVPEAYHHHTNLKPQIIAVLDRTLTGLYENKIKICFRRVIQLTWV